MAIPRVYWPEELTCGQNVSLSTAVTHHLLTVLRLKDGETVLLFNGEAEYETVLSVTGKRAAQLRVIKQTDSQPESTLKLEFAACLYRGKQLDASIQKAVELGVHSIAPIISHKSDVIQKAADKRQASLQKVILAACEQSGRIKPPQLQTEISFDTWLQQASGKKAIACDFGQGTLDWSAHPLTEQWVSVLIGPAGGFTADESRALAAADTPNLSLGPRILRSDTATITALSLVQQRWGDLG
jgi:16S rRNA (uracil1498-N3)-methyltransferase